MDTLAPSQVRLRVLGGFDLSGVAGGDIPVSGKKLRALVTLLALPPRLGWSREQLTTMLWGDRDEELARGSLRQALAELRRILGEPAVLADRETVALDPAFVTIDAVEFAACIATGDWGQAAALYRGDLLNGISTPDGDFADWLLVERTRLHDLAIQALSRLIAAQSGNEAIETALRLQVLDPDREETYRTLMRLHAAAGDRAQAIRHYQLCRDRLWRELGVKPESETDRLFDEIKTGAGTPPRAPAHEPVPIVQAAPPAESAPKWSSKASVPRWKEPRLAAVAALTLLLGVVLSTWLYSAGRTTDPPGGPAANGPSSVAVLPFENLSDDPTQSYLADGIADDLMANLSRMSGLFVIARNSTFAYRGKPPDVRAVARDLGVGYVIEGSVRRAGNQIRINVRLIDAKSARQVWAERYDSSSSDIFALQDRVTAAIADALALQLTADEQRLLAQHDTTVPAAYEAFLRGWELYRRATPDSFVLAIPHFEQAVEADPEYGRAYAALAMIYFQGFDQDWSGTLRMSSADAYRQAVSYLKKAEKHPTSTSHQVAGNIARQRGWYDDALNEFQAAIALEPNDSWSYAYSAYALMSAERPAEAEEQIRVAMQRDPRHPPVFVFYLGLAQLMLDRWREAAATLANAVSLSPDDPQPALYLAAAYGMTDRMAEAQKALGRVNAIRVKQGGIPFVLGELAWKHIFAYMPFAPVASAQLVAGLRKAGAPYWFESGAFDEQQLHAHEIDRLIFGHRIHGRSLHSGQEHGASVFADGAAIMFGDWGAGSGAAKLYDDRLCFEWTTGDTNCGVFYRNVGGTRAKENEYIWFSHRGGGFAFSQVE
ncbi:MAG: BTAD domain-containing putative transcriptional regulator [Dongiaceae bacterium]